MGDVVERAKQEVEVEKRNIETEALKNSLIRIEQAEKALVLLKTSHQKLIDSINTGTFDHFNNAQYARVCRG